jgi:glucose-6-phosphate 1-dehydrogenase
VSARNEARDAREAKGEGDVVQGAWPQHRPVPGDPCVLVIFGATGDLTRRKLLPSLLNLSHAGLLPAQLAIVGVGREAMDDSAFHVRMTEGLAGFASDQVPQAARDDLVRRMRYLSGDFSDPNLYLSLRTLLAEIDAKEKTRGNVLYYLATPPQVFAPIVHALGAAGMVTEQNGSWRRVIVEKPFGEDLESARALNQELRRDLEERQIYRIDHYLGKETVQNILVFRFANGIFEPVWNRRYIDHVQITVAESDGIEKRGRYYDAAGALRDMVPNHLFQLLSFIAMEPPISFESGSVRDEKAKVLHAIAPMSEEEVLRRTVRGQYREGTGLDGRRHAGYRAEEFVKAGSSTETFVALKLYVDNWRWAEVPFYLRTGKGLAERVTEIVIQFKRAPFVLFRDTEVERLPANTLVLNIQPDEGISLRFQAKVPGPTVRMGEVEMDFKYAEHFGEVASTGYETLLHDCMVGDATLFQRDDMVEAGWRIVQPILDVFQALPPRNFPNYPYGSSGPREAEELLGRDGRKWKAIGDDSGGRRRGNQDPAGAVRN